MTTGDFLTRLTVWLALAAYALATGCMARHANRIARWFWTLGCACYLSHVVCAFGFFHEWSHAAAYAETARQTRELVGWNWGGGLFVNYLFTLVWLVDVLWWWLAPASHGLRVAGSGFGVPPLGGRARLALGGELQQRSPLRERAPDRLKAELRTRNRPRTATVLLHGFFLFMVFNGTVVFGRGPVRWYGAVICATVVWCWARILRERPPAK